MDWSRAKTILILSFLALNLLLGYELWSGKLNLGDSKQASADIAEELNRIMISRGMKLAAEVPKETPKMREIVVKAVEDESYGRKVSLSAPIRYNLFLSKGSLKDLANRAIPKIESYSYDRITSKEGLFMMNQLVGEYPLFDINLELFITGAEVTGYRQSYVEVDTSSEAKEEKKVISAYTVLRTLAEKYFPNGAVVTDIRLGYHGQFFDTEWSTLPTFPTWRVALENGDMYYVHGFRGDVENAPRSDASKP